MAKFREFYVQPGAGSNFLAGKCLWTDNADSREHLEYSRTSTNEFFFDREQINNVWHEIPSEVHKIHEDIFNSKYESKKIKKILIELDKIIKSISPNDDATNRTYRDEIINNIEFMWERDCSYQCQAFREHITPDMYFPDEIPKSVVDKIRQIEDYFIKCREYYFTLCENMNWNSFMISHLHPYNAYTSRLKLPENFKSLVMEFDGTTNIIISALQHIKKDYSINKNHDWIADLTDDAYTKKRLDAIAKLSDDTISYRKIFLENDENEVMKIYDFFDNKDYFEENKTNIMKEFKEYHGNNMAVIQKFIPKLYKQLKPR